VPLIIRHVTQRELAIPLQWAAEEGWNPGVSDAEPFHAADPRGFLVATVENEPVGCISVVRYDSAFGFLGLYIVRPEFRGRGYGRSLWRTGLVHLDGCIVGLDGVVAQQANYARSGFELAYRNVRYVGVASGQYIVHDPRVKSVDEEFVDAISSFDRRYFPTERKTFLQSWLTSNGRKALVFIDDGDLQGYGVLRACREGFKIGPLFAETPQVAEALLQALISDVENMPVSIDVPEPNIGAAALSSSFGLEPIFETARMYKGSAPELRVNGVYGVTTLELG
jgi:GNAT superfamily N-acetyltransferase